MSPTTRCTRSSTWASASSASCAEADAQLGGRPARRPPPRLPARIGTVTDRCRGSRAEHYRFPGEHRDPDLRRAHRARRRRALRGALAPARRRGRVRGQGGRAEAHRHRRAGAGRRARRSPRRPDARHPADPRRRGQPARCSRTRRSSTGSAPSHAGSEWTTSVCTGSLVLGAAGVLEGLRATSHWAYLDRLRSTARSPSPSAWSWTARSSRRRASRRESTWR